MNEQKKLFRPSLVIFVDEPGERIYEQFKSILLSFGLDTHLQTGVGLIHYTQKSLNPFSKQVVPSELVTNIFAREKQSFDQSAVLTKFHTAQPKAEEKLLNEGALALYEAIKDMRDSLSRYLPIVRKEGYTVLCEAVQIFIVGSANTLLFTNALQAVQNMLQTAQEEKMQEDVYLLLYSYSTGQIPRANVAPRLSTLKTFSFMFENTSVTPHSEQVSRYLMAQALYVLIATGLTSDSLFARALWPASATPGMSRAGYLVTCSLQYPDALLAEYCSAHLGAEIMTQWDVEMKQDVTLAAKQYAERTMNEIKAWMKSKTAPKLFAPFALVDEDETYESWQKYPGAHIESMRERASEDIDKRFQIWVKEMGSWGEQLKKEIQRQIGVDVAVISNEQLYRFQLISLYLNECQTQLENELSSYWGKQRQEQFERAKTNLLTSSNIARNKQESTPDNQLSLEVKIIIESAQRRLTCEQSLLDMSPWTFLAANILVAPPLIVAILTLFPTWSILIIVEAVAVLLLAGDILFHRLQRKGARRLRESLLELHTSSLARASDYEMALPSDVEQAITEVINEERQSANAHLQKFREVIAQVQTGLDARQKQALQSLKNLLSSLQITRDILVGAKAVVAVNEHGERIIRHQIIDIAYAEDLANSIGVQQDGLFHWFKEEIIGVEQHNQSAQVAEAEVVNKVQHHIQSTFVEQYIEKYALDAHNLDQKLWEELWEEAFSRVQCPLSRQPLGSPALLLICSGNEDLRTSGANYARKHTQSKVIEVLTDQRQWILLAGFFDPSNKG